MREFKRLIKGKFNSESFNDLNNGIIYLKGGDLTIELLGIINKQISISKYFNEEFFETKKIVYVKN